MEKERSASTSGPSWDPVCGMLVKAENAHALRRYEGLEIYFCSAGCLRRFDADPQKYMQTKHMREYAQEVKKRARG